MLYRAFLSHASTDKEFVGAVAKELGRQFCLIDEQVFENGEQFKHSIEKMLDESQIFVLFVSENTLKRLWVKFEITEAWYRKLEGKISKSLVFILSTSIQYEDIPKWLNRAKISKSVNSPKAIAREIRHHLDNLLMTQRQTYFEGRSKHIANFEKVLTPIGQRAPRIVGVYGLPNVGRRTFISKIAQLSLSYSKTIEIPVADGDTLAGISIKIANLLEPFSTKEGFDSIVNSIYRLSEDELLERDIANLRAAVGYKELPILIDEGGLLTSDGLFVEPIQKLIEKIETYGDLYLFAVLSRKPPQSIPYIYLPPLDKEDTQRLISKIADDQEVSLDASQIRDISEYVNGYPPCAYYAIYQAKMYGVSSLIIDKRRLVQFRTSVFVKYLNEKQFTNEQRSILLILARYSPIPFEILVKSLSLAPTTVMESLIKLLDHSLVVLDSNGMYEIASPVLEAVLNSFREDSIIDHKLVYDAFMDLLNVHDDKLPRLQLYRHLYRAAILTGANKDNLFSLNSDLIAFTKDFYHRREYRQCIEASRLAIDESPESLSGRDFLIRSLIQEGLWDEAEKEIKTFYSYAPLRDYHFIKGFFYRKSNNLNLALEEFHLAEKNGRKGSSLQREIAHCYFLLGDLSKAKQYVTNGLAIKENRFLLDLKIQIAIEEKQEKDARDGLVLLEAIDSEAFYWHRLSTVELRFGTSNHALEAAQFAVKIAKGRPFFGMLAQLMICQIREKLYSDADSTLQKLNSSYGSQKKDIILGFECRLEIERKRYPKALSILERINDTSTPVYLSMKRDALSGILGDALDDIARKKYDEELTSLNEQLQDFDDIAAWLSVMQ